MARLPPCILCSASGIKFTLTNQGVQLLCPYALIISGENWHDLTLLFLAACNSVLYERPCGTKLRLCRGIMWNTHTFEINIHCGCLDNATLEVFFTVTITLHFISRTSRLFFTLAWEKSQNDGVVCIKWCSGWYTSLTEVTVQLSTTGGLKR